MMSQSEQIFGTSYCPRQLLPRDKGVIMGCRKRALWDCRRGTMACLGEELKVGKGRDLDSFGQKQVWEMRNKGIKGPGSV